ncbi:MAG: hypothetical protein AAGU74_08945 [Bacillota bacterium]
MANEFARRVMANISLQYGAAQQESAQQGAAQQESAGTPCRLDPREEALLVMQIRQAPPISGARQCIDGARPCGESPRPSRSGAGMSLRELAQQNQQEGKL